MCGIAGAVGREGKRTSRVAAMLHALRRRGPDSEGIHEWPGAVLGHRRLSIFDLSAAGHQPMLSRDGAVGVVFNGAIYNFRPLRRELEVEGFTFTSDADTEVLVHGYVAWGIDGLLDRIRGMFAFAVWDDRTRKLFLVRDRLGVKPLAYALRPGGLAFASTPRALKAAGQAGAISPVAIGEFLQFGFVTEARSIYEGIAKLAPASVAEWSENGFRVRRYWRPTAHRSDDGMSFEDAVEETERLLLRAVELRLHADVPVAALLSGGIDSTLICWAIAKLNGNITAYTVGTPGHAMDESADAVATAQQLGIRHEVLATSDTDNAGLEELTLAYAEPFACSSALGMLRLSRTIASTSAKVLLTGDGGDDVFLGYPRHLLLRRTQSVAHWVPGIVTAGWMQLRRAIPRRGLLKRLVHLIDYTTGGLASFVAANPGLPDFRRHGLLGERFAAVESVTPQKDISIQAARSALADYLAYDWQTQFVSEYLVKVDGSTMHYALEARSPFLDQELWGFAASLPFDVRLYHGRLKAILREIARRRLGDRVARGRKRGFGVPVETWIGGRWHSLVAERLREPLIVSDGWVRQPPLNDEVAEAKRSGVASRRLWYLWVLEEWLRAERSTTPGASDLATTSRQHRERHEGSGTAFR
jgi:asparagine synthase (glutamine-hydrolysing)